jgi:hypothetical protein
MHCVFADGASATSAPGETAARAPRNSGIPIVLMTGDRRFRPIDGAQVLEKPFGVAELLEVLRNALDTDRKGWCGFLARATRV